MKKFIRISLKILFIIIFLMISIAIILPFIIDPNDYKDEIAALVAEKSGRELAMPGDIELSFFPWLGAEIGAVELSNAKGFDKTAFARIKGIDVHVKLLPLFRGQLEVGKITLHGLNLNLQRNKRGRTNWDDLIKETKPLAQEKTAPPAAAEAAEPPSPAVMLAALAIEGVEIKNAGVVWDDQATNQFYQLDAMNLEVGRVALDRPFPLAAGLQFKSRQPAATGSLALSTEIQFDPEQQIVTLNDLKLGSRVNSTLLPGETLDSELTSSRLQADLDQQTLTAESLALSAYGLNLHSTIKAQNILSQPRYQVRLAIDEFAPKQLLQSLAISLPPMTDKKALSQASLSAQINGTTEEAAIEKLILNADDSEVTGRASIKDFARPVVRYDININTIDVDRYLPPPAPADETQAKQTVATPGAAAAAVVQLPMDQLRALDINGTLRLQRLKIMNLQAQDIRLTTTAKNGRLRLHPLGAQLYQGQYSGDVRIDVTGPEPRLTMSESLSKVQIGPLLKDFMGDDHIRGRADLGAKLAATGIDPMKIRRTLNGATQFRFAEGEIKDLDMEKVDQNLRQLDDDLKAIFSSDTNLVNAQQELAALSEKWKAVTAKGSGKNTYFSQMSGSASIKQGLLTNKDLRVQIPYGRIRGEGQVNLVNETADYTAYVKLTSKADIKGAGTYETIDKIPLKIYFKGKLAELTPQPDFKDYIKAYGKQALKKLEAREKAKVKKKVEETIQREKDKVEEKLEQKLKDKLQKLFKF